MSAIKSRISHTNQLYLELSVIIVNYNVKYFLELCLHAVIKACAAIETEIFVVDNNSADGSKEYLPQRFPGIRFTWQETNTGFAKANNSVLREAKGRYILFLNPDTIVPEDCFEKCLDFLRANDDAGALGVRMLDGSGKFLRESKRSFPTPLASLFKLTGFSSLFPSSKLFSAYYAGHLPEHQSGEVDVLAGAFIMSGRHCLEKMNGFDEDFFMYGEDIDLSYRMQKAGFKNYYFAGTTIIHFKGESSQKTNAAYIREFYNAMEIFLSKHYKENRATHFIMRSAILASRIMAFIKAGLINMISIKGISSVMQVAVIADQRRFEEMIRLMKHSKRPLVFRGRIASDPAAKGIHIGTIENIPQLIKKYDLNELVFCEGVLSFKAIIEKLQSLSKKTGFLFHAEGSNSVVGSSWKNEKGIFIAKE